MAVIHERAIGSKPTTKAAQAALAVDLTNSRRDTGVVMTGPLTTETSLLLCCVPWEPRFGNPQKWCSPGYRTYGRQHFPRRNGKVARHPLAISQPPRIGLLEPRSRVRNSRGLLKQRRLRRQFGSIPRIERCLSYVRKRSEEHTSELQ